MQQQTHGMRPWAAIYGRYDGQLFIVDMMGKAITFTAYAICWPVFLIGKSRNCAFTFNFIAAFTKQMRLAGKGTNVCMDDSWAGHHDAPMDDPC